MLSRGFLGSQQRGSKDEDRGFFMKKSECIGDAVDSVIREGVRAGAVASDSTTGDVASGWRAEGRRAEAGAVVAAKVSGGFSGGGGGGTSFVDGAADGEDVASSVDRDSLSS